MTKQEKIQEAYGEHWAVVKNIVNPDGWFYCSETDFRLDSIMPLQYDGYNNKMRPKSLQGIENNNGWIKIESEDDLPKDIDGLWEVFINGEQKFIELLKYNKERLYKDFLKDGITHYKICNKSQPPLY